MTHNFQYRNIISQIYHNKAIDIIENLVENNDLLTHLKNSYSKNYLKNNLEEITEEDENNVSTITKNEDYNFPNTTTIIEDRRLTISDIYKSNLKQNIDKIKDSLKESNLLKSNVINCDNYVVSENNTINNENDDNNNDSVIINQNNFLIKNISQLNPEELKPPKDNSKKVKKKEIKNKTKNSNKLKNLNLNDNPLFKKPLKNTNSIAFLKKSYKGTIALNPRNFESLKLKNINLQSHKDLNNVKHNFSKKPKVIKPLTKKSITKKSVKTSVQKKNNSVTKKSVTSRKSQKSIKKTSVNKNFNWMDKIDKLIKNIPFKNSSSKIKNKFTIDKKYTTFNKSKYLSSANYSNSFKRSINKSPSIINNKIINNSIKIKSFYNKPNMSTNNWKKIFKDDISPKKECRTSRNGTKSKNKVKKIDSKDNFNKLIKNVYNKNNYFSNSNGKIN